MKEICRRNKIIINLNKSEIMKKASVLLMFLVVQGVFAQSAYEKGMQKAFQFWGANNVLEASNTFERIATAEKENWLPSYYAAQVNIVSCFGEKKTQVFWQLN